MSVTNLVCKLGLPALKHGLHVPKLLAIRGLSGRFTSREFGISQLRVTYSKGGTALFERTMKR